MNIVEILNNKSYKAVQKRGLIISVIMEKSVSLNEIERTVELLNDKQTAVILEAIEITNKKMMQLDISYIKFAEKYILSDHNSCKREASRIIGNMADQYPDELESAIKCLMENKNSDSTVVRWGCAYALSRIIVLDQFANSDLFNEISDLCEIEQENGVKNQYIKALKKASKLRR